MSREVQAIDPLTRAEFRPTGRENAIHMVSRVPSSRWDDMSIKEKLDAAEKAYLSLTRKGDQRSDQEERKLNSLQRWFTVLKRKNRQLQAPVESFFQKVKRLRDRIKKRSCEMTGQDIQEMARRIAVKKIRVPKGKKTRGPSVAKLVGAEANWSKMPMKRKVEKIQKFLLRPGVDPKHQKKMKFWLRTNLTKATDRRKTNRYFEELDRALKAIEAGKKPPRVRLPRLASSQDRQEEILRKGLIRLAHEHPEFRDDILPLVTQ